MAHFSGGVVSLLGAVGTQLILEKRRAAQAAVGERTAQRSMDFLEALHDLNVFS